MTTVRTFEVGKIELMRVGSRQDAMPGQVLGIQPGDRYQACQDGPDVVVGIPLQYKTGREVEKVYDASGPEGKSYRVILSSICVDRFSRIFGNVRLSDTGYPGTIVVTVREVQP